MDNPDKQAKLHELTDEEIKIMENLSIGNKEV